MTTVQDSRQNSRYMQPGTIMAALTKGGLLGSYHWIIYVCKETTDKGAGYKFHATNRANTAPWRYACEEWDGPQSRTCVTLTPIGKLSDWGPKTEQDCIQALDRILREVPMAVSSPDNHDFRTFTCRAWFRAAIRQLHYHRYLNCPDVIALESRLLNTAIAIHSQGNEGARFFPPLIWPEYAPSRYVR
ncbi:hypothetical protein C8T65DRAFT_683350 [Cerioporus squamosus]|nr:hypothetical protein C8T65DRAFT_683350 [Cerioporus squamosus]